MKYKLEIEFNAPEGIYLGHLKGYLFDWLSNVAGVRGDYPLLAGYEVNSLEVKPVEITE